MSKIERITPNDPRLPPNLWLAEPCDAEILPDGRAVPLTIPPAVRAFHYPDLPMSDGIHVPTVTIMGTDFHGATVVETIVPLSPTPDDVPTPSNTLATPIIFDTESPAEAEDTPRPSAEE